MVAKFYLLYGSMYYGHHIDDHTYDPGVYSVSIACEWSLDLEKAEIFTSSAYYYYHISILSYKPPQRTYYLILWIDYLEYTWNWKNYKIGIYVYIYIYNWISTDEYVCILG